MNKTFIKGIATGVVILLLAQLFFFNFSGIRIDQLFLNNKIASDGFSDNVTSLPGDELKVDPFANPAFKSFDAKATKVLEVLNKNYYEAVDEQVLYEEAIRGMVAGLGDPYTSYFTRDEYTDFMEKMEGSYDGIGVVVSYGEDKDTILVVAPFKNSPGEQAGIKSKDRIIAVDGTNTIGMDIDKVVALIKGKKGTTVVLKVQRGDQTFDISIIRDTIEVPTVDSKMLEGQIGYIQISSFDLVTGDQFKEALAALEKQKAKGLIIDLRNNPGGYLNICFDMIEELLDKDLLVVYTEDKMGKRDELITRNKNQFDKPLVLLVNGNSASASEIMAGAIKDHNKGTIVGETTFGKGLVQRTYDLDDASAIKVTIAKYYTPKGYYIHDVGIKPDVEIIYDPDSQEDNQLNKAIEVITLMNE